MPRRHIFSSSSSKQQKKQQQQQHHSSPLDVILAAQQGQLDDSFFPTYQDARMELQYHGRKASCWMWYIWPSLKTIRQHRMPKMLLHNFDQATEYLSHPTLGRRLVEMTAVANQQILENGVRVLDLFGGCKIDAIKYHEACTVFGCVAIAVGDKQATAVFVQALVSLGGRLNHDAVVKGLHNQKQYVQTLEELLVMETTPRNGSKTMNDQTIECATKDDKQSHTQQQQQSPPPQKVPDMKATKVVQNDAVKQND